MSSIIIDGYNVIGVLHSDMEAERRRFIESLMEYRKQKGHEITVVFDGWREGRGSEQASVTGGVRVVYSALGEKADAVIKRMISAGTGRQWIVISSDRDIQAHAWARGAVPVGAEDFLRRLESSGRQEKRTAAEDEYDRPQRKGNPRQPSKKDRALKKALEKL